MFTCLIMLCPGRLKCAPTVFFSDECSFNLSLNFHLCTAVCSYLFLHVMQYTTFSQLQSTLHLSSTLNFVAELSTIKCSEIWGPQQQFAFLHFFIPTIFLRSRVDSGSLVFTSRCAFLILYKGCSIRFAKFFLKVLLDVSTLYFLRSL